MEIRKELYTRIINQLAFFTSTVSEKESDAARGELLRLNREVQLWGSDEVTRKFKKLLDLMADKSSLEEARNFRYKDFVVAMRQDILGESCMSPEEIDIRGLVKNKN
jgi:hypothetical protein